MRKLKDVTEAEFEAAIAGYDSLIVLNKVKFFEADYYKDGKFVGNKWSMPGGRTLPFERLFRVPAED